MHSHRHSQCRQAEHGQSDLEAEGFQHRLCRLAPMRVGVDAQGQFAQGWHDENSVVGEERLPFALHGVALAQRRLIAIEIAMTMQPPQVSPERLHTGITYPGRERHEDGTDLAERDVKPKLRQTIDRRWCSLLDRVTGIRQVLACTPKRGLGGLGQSLLDENGSAFGSRRTAERPRRPHRIARVTLCHYRQRELRVPDRPRERTVYGHALHGEALIHPARRGLVEGGDTTHGRTKPDYAIAIGRPPDGAADIIALRQCADA